jgi:hypothetical protein
MFGVTLLAYAVLAIYLAALAAIDFLGGWSNAALVPG